MSFRADLISEVLANIGLSALIDDRLWPDKSPQSPDLPYIIVFEIGGSSEQSFSCERITGQPAFRFIISDSTYSKASAVGEALWAALLATGRPVIFESERTDTNQMTGVHRRDLDVRISYER